MWKTKALVFTHWFDRKDECLSWYEWFRKGGIPAAIVELGGKFAVFRQGKLERKRNDGAVITIDPPEIEVNDEYRIMEECHGFKF